MGNIEGLIEGQKHLMVIGKMMGVHHLVAHRQLLAAWTHASRLSVSQCVRKIYGFAFTPPASQPSRAEHQMCRARCTPASFLLM